MNDISNDLCIKDYAKLFDAIKTAIFVDDGSGNTLFINKSCEDLYLIEREDIIGKDIYTLEDQAIFRPSVAKEVLIKKREVSIIHNNRAGKKLLTTGIPIFDEDGNIEMIVSTSRDITELVNMQNNLEKMKSKIVELEGKDDFFGELITKSHKMTKLKSLIGKLSKIDTTILINGESGVGKSTLAEFIHKSGNRQDKPFVKVNCGAIPENLLESELFGYVEGAFTGSKKEGKKGMFEQANNGTILLDEISELPLHLQVKILQVIQDKEIQKVGSEEKIKVNVRIITATNKNLFEMVKRNEFREDLFYRLNVVPILIPPLRERKEDVMNLIYRFQKKTNEKLGTNKFFNTEAIGTLLEYDWPGNVRELENVIERIFIVSDKNEISQNDIPVNIRNEKESSAYDMCLKNAMENIEKKMIINAIRQCGSTRRAATVLGISQPSVVRKAKKYGIALC